MPELAEVEFYRKRWDTAAVGEKVVNVLTHDKKKLLRELDLGAFRRALTGATLLSSEARAKQMLFQFSGDIWLGIHLGMSGELRVEAAGYEPGKHDHLVLVTQRRSTEHRSRGRHAGAGNDLDPIGARPSGDEFVSHVLVFTDPRMFGSVDFHIGKEPPIWWSRIAPGILSKTFTVEAVGNFLQRRQRAPIKAVLLMQERFPGVGNWMADEILWRAAIHPARLAGSLTPGEVRTLWRECRHVCRLALETIAGHGGKLPPDLNVNIPDTWLFNHRWARGGTDPKTGTPLEHATIGGRTTCWSPATQKL